MRKINVAGLYYIGYMVHPLTTIRKDFTYEDIWEVLVDAQQGLESVEPFDKILNLSFSRRSFTQLKQAVDTALESYKATPQEVISAEDYYSLTYKVQHFETVFATDIQSLNTYAVAQSMAYNTGTLIDSGEEVIHESLRGYLPDVARKDLREATRCLAYQLNTAVGFHILRAVEATIMEFMDLLNIPRPTQPAQRNLGNYITLLRSAGVDGRILLPLDQIRALHRNELMHPDRSLDDTESSSLFEVSKAALTALLIDIKARTPALPTVVGTAGPT